MHSRGDALTMQSLAHYGRGGSSSGGVEQPPVAASASAAKPLASVASGGSTSDGGEHDCSEAADGSDVVAEVAAVLSLRAAAAVRAGVRRWAIVLDPGLGFSKQPAHSFALLRPAASLVHLRFPLLYAPSRKGFLGAVTGEVVPERRVWATAAAVSACVAVGADIVRVHDVREMKHAAAVADAVYLSCAAGPGPGVPALRPPVAAPSPSK